MDGYGVWREPDGWWGRVYANFRVVWLNGPYKSSKKAQTACKAVQL